MDIFDIIMIIFFLLVPAALIVVAILLAKTKRTLHQTQQELASTQERLWQLEAAQSAKNSNQVNRI